MSNSDSHIPLRANEIRQRMAHYLYWALPDTPPTGGRIALYLFVALIELSTLFGIPLAIYHLFKAFRRQPHPERAELIAFVHRGVPVWACPVMVNRVLRKPGTERAPGLVLISFEPSSAESWNQLCPALGPKRRALPANCSKMRNFNAIAGASFPHQLRATKQSMRVICSSIRRCS
jgi:hypothetical protein